MNPRGINPLFKQPHDSNSRALKAGAAFSLIFVWGCRGYQVVLWDACDMVGLGGEGLGIRHAVRCGISWILSCGVDVVLWGNISEGVRVVWVYKVRWVFECFWLFGRSDRDPGLRSNIEDTRFNSTYPFKVNSDSVAVE